MAPSTSSLSASNKTRASMVAALLHCGNDAHGCSAVLLEYVLAPSLLNTRAANSPTPNGDLHALLPRGCHARHATGQLPAQFHICFFSSTNPLTKRNHTRIWSKPCTASFSVPVARARVSMGLVPHRSSAIVLFHHRARQVAAKAVCQVTVIATFRINRSAVCRVD